MELVTEQIEFILTTYPFMKHVLAWYFILRMINKPLFSVFARYVQLTEEIEDNEKYNKIINSKTYKMISFILDMGASIKLPKAKKRK
jgi:hypothetical protein